MNPALNDPLNLCNGCDTEAATEAGGYCKPCLEADSAQAVPRYPDVEVELIGRDGNAFFIIGRVQKALKRVGVPAEEVTAFREEATSGDYNNVLTTAMKWVTVE